MRHDDDRDDRDDCEDYSGRDFDDPNDGAFEPSFMRWTAERGSYCAHPHHDEKRDDACDACGRFNVVHQ